MGGTIRDGYGGNTGAAHVFPLDNPARVMTQMYLAPPARGAQAPFHAWTLKATVPDTIPESSLFALVSCFHDILFYSGLSCNS